MSTPKKGLKKPRVRIPVPKPNQVHKSIKDYNRKLNKLLLKQQEE